MHGYYPFKRVIAKCNWQRKAIPESPISKVNLATINPYKEVHGTQTYNTRNLAELVIMGSINHVWPERHFYCSNTCILNNKETKGTGKVA